MKKLFLVLIVIVLVATAVMAVVPQYTVLADSKAVQCAQSGWGNNPAWDTFPGMPINLKVSAQGTGGFNWRIVMFKTSYDSVQVIKFTGGNLRYAANESSPIVAVWYWSGKNTPAKPTSSIYLTFNTLKKAVTTDTYFRLFQITNPGTEMCIGEAWVHPGVQPPSPKP